ncbi:molybdenum cofactor sulfurase [Mesorhizobium sp. BAC0120]|uniref:MOSC domain-containing protein n=1 Tax=Mesorhizobium sp. BAC0120 TaxID=3090670 RepID=UPI00298CCE6F|nr:MOSC domain-containing protein [Mesorhizobium sp. BAC0120]MDW6026238.1 molybdenum cofactor sulfurase [Mesorhizobium sp. BAC0120]
MLDLLQPPDDIEILPARKLEARVTGVFAAYGKDFVTEAVDALALSFEGVERDLHSGVTRRSGSREPWYPRGTEMRNARQLSIVASDELAIVAGRMGIAEIKPEWIGANLVIDGVPRLSMLPSGTLLFFANGATVKVGAQNGPCRFSGESIARNAGMKDVAAGALLFPKVAKRLRGLVGWVEKPGTIRAGEKVSVRVPEQWIYRG